MKRVLLADPLPDAGPVTHDGEPFTGVGFRRHADGSVSAHHYEGGIKGPEYQPLVVDGGPARPAVDREILDGGDYDPVLLDGELFSGLSYGFFRGRCSYEKQFVNGLNESYIHWTADDYGRPYNGFQIHHRGTPAFVEMGRCHDPGCFESFMVNGDGDLGCVFRFDPDGLLWHARIEPGFTRNFEYVRRRATFFPFESADAMLASILSARFELVGAGIDDAFLAGLLKRGDVSRVNALSLSDTRLSMFDHLDGFPGLESVAVKSKTPDPAVENAARAFKSRRPEVAVTVNETEVLA